MQARRVAGRYHEDSGMIIIEQFACEKSKKFCKDESVGIMTWETMEPTCSKTYSEIFTGKAQLYNGKQNESKIIVIGSKEEESYAGKF